MSLGKKFMLSSGKDSSGKDRKIAFVIPAGIQHISEIQAVIDLIKQYSETHGVALADIPQFHRMVTCYDIYIGCFEVVSEKGSTMMNQRGECVKRPEVNIMRENWAQYLEIAKQYGFTPRSSKMTPSSGNEVRDTPADQFFSDR